MGRQKWGGVDGGGGWAAEGELKPLLGLLEFGLAMSLQSDNHRPKYA